ncbi:hypothetical protein Metev_0610 [Methanohalobium evestigatum Z-7303]|uniref:Uncharacterized protein n=1 Tax=Methanohalobium evestigatum (strain ATCC BAA-1072 / DSM 3721 / NBRC 107634 / OCM 161 / Z-7303) TaxID=644295 RepID=D7E8H4_METEZ|nr:hypothetical protein [Methanohalobium evestigatum]ADI73516.1 hypothetical protein Metev_0610 [Methanohalobium evestigatum Z-7303]
MRISKQQKFNIRLVVGILVAITFVSLVLLFADLNIIESMFFVAAVAGIITMVLNDARKLTDREKNLIASKLEPYNKLKHANVQTVTYPEDLLKKTNPPYTSYFICKNCKKPIGINIYGHKRYINFIQNKMTNILLVLTFFVYMVFTPLIPHYINSAVFFVLVMTFITINASNRYAHRFYDNRSLNSVFDNRPLRWFYEHV